MRECENAMKRSADSMRFTPPASAIAQSFARNAWQARWIATSDDEQAVSSVRLGPCRPSR